MIFFVPGMLGLAGVSAGWHVYVALIGPTVAMALVMPAAGSYLSQLVPAHRQGEAQVFFAVVLRLPAPSVLA